MTCAAMACGTGERVLRHLRTALFTARVYLRLLAHRHLGSAGCIPACTHQRASSFNFSTLLSSTSHSAAVCSFEHPLGAAEAQAIKATATVALRSGKRIMMVIVMAVVVLVAALVGSRK